MQNAPRIVFAGVHMEALSPFRYLIEAGENMVGLVTLTEEAKRGVSGAMDLTPHAATAGIPVLPVRSINAPETISWVRDREPDVLLVVGWTQLLREDMLRLPKIACLGFHASLLPKYRGRAPINWALIHGEEETGNTLMVLEPGADEGDIVAQRRIPITTEDDCRTLYEKVAETEIEMLAEVLPQIRAGYLPRRKQDSSRATVMPKRRPEDGLIDWSRSARQVYNWVRALTHPYPGAFSYIPDGGLRKILIWKVGLCAEPSAAGPPGTVVSSPDRLPLAATGSGWVRLLCVEREGEGQISGREAAFLKEGSRFTSLTEERQP